MKYAFIAALFLWLAGTCAAQVRSAGSNAPQGAGIQSTQNARPTVASSTVVNTVTTQFGSMCRDESVARTLLAHALIRFPNSQVRSDIHFFTEL
jgi:hypothetical protein